MQLQMAKTDLNSCMTVRALLVKTEFSKCSTSEQKCYCFCLCKTGLAQLHLQRLIQTWCNRAEAWLSVTQKKGISCTDAGIVLQQSGRLSQAPAKGTNAAGQTALQ